MNSKLLPLFRYACVSLFFLFSLQSNSQDSVSIAISKIPSSYFDKTTKLTHSLTTNINKKSNRLLTRLQRSERKTKNQFFKLDSAAASHYYQEGANKYAALASQFNVTISPQSSISSSGEYLPYIDSLQGSLQFLDKFNAQLSSDKKEKLDKALSGFKTMQAKLKSTEELKAFLRERQQQLKDLTAKYTSLPKNLSRQFKTLNKQAFYYAEQVRQYKEIFRDPTKLQTKALGLLNKLPVFQKFMKENSALAGLFSVPGSYGSSGNLTGLQTRSQVQQLITTQMGGGANAGQLFGQQVQAAQTQLAKFKDKLDQLGGNSGDVAMPDFKPNNQKTKSFLKRLEFGTNLQSTKNNAFFPSTTDIGLSLGYRLNDKSIVGIGTSYKIGWGTDIRHIDLSSQGIGIRSFADVKIKNSFYASGGFEYNYQQPFSSAQQLYQISSWQQSGLVGVSKIVSLKSKAFKKTKLQLLWDFLSYKQFPRTQPLKFRVGYNF